MQLTDSDKKWWAPLDRVTSYVAAQIADGARVLEIGPGYVPFPKATYFVDFVPERVKKAPNHYHCDLSQDALPFADKSFDFIYCRHVLEDMYNPFLLAREMSRVGKAGYIETPSPLAEVARGIDGASPVYRGYHHHRFIIWVRDGKLRFVSKYPLIEYLRFPEMEILGSLRAGPQFWNTYYFWSGDVGYTHLQCPMDYDITRDYRLTLNTAIEDSRASTTDLWARFTDIQIQNLQKEIA